MADSIPLGTARRARRAPEEKFREFLEIRGEKLTEPRRVLIRHIFDSHKHFDPTNWLPTSAGRPPGQPGDGLSDPPAPVEARPSPKLLLTNSTAYEHDFELPLARPHARQHGVQPGSKSSATTRSASSTRRSAPEHGFRASAHRPFVIPTGVWRVGLERDHVGRAVRACTRLAPGSRGRSADGAPRPSLLRSTEAADPDGRRR